MLFGLEGCLQRHIKNPVLLITATSDEVDCLASLEDFVRQVVREEGRDHNVVQFVLFGPQFVIAHVWISLHEKLLKRIVYLSSHHPGLNHGENRSGDLLENTADESLCRGAPIEHVSVNGRANGATFEVLNEVGDHGKPLHTLKGLLDPEVELAEVQVVG